MFRLILATRNAHKTREFAQILGPEFEVHDLTRWETFSEVEETGSTFEENAILKAVAASRLVSDLVVADDSGLEVTALGGAPGIYSARYAGETATDPDNVAKLLTALEATPESREACFRCAIALVQKGKTIATFDGWIEGRIATSLHGGDGFGYDPVFIPNGFDQTFAELGDETKNRISHRAAAINKLRAYLQTLSLD